MNEEKGSLIGQIVDYPFEEFKAELDRQKLNIGELKNLILFLVATYDDLVKRKDKILDYITDGTISLDDAREGITGLYNEMMKLEEKVTYLKQRVDKLTILDGDKYKGI